VVDQNQLNIISNINSSEKSIIKIYNMIGEDVFIKKLNFFNNQIFQISLPSNLTSGTYIVSLKVGKEIKNQKIIF
jgi:methionine-rich copper-binding protein CopC